MSEQKHTQGTLEVIEYGDEILAYGWELVDDGSDPGAVAVCYREKGVDAEANARRLAACWNACQGISTEALEAGVIGDLAVAYQSLVAVSPDLLDLWTDEIREQVQNALAKMKGQA